MISIRPAVKFNPFLCGAGLDRGGETAVGVEVLGEDFAVQLNQDIERGVKLGGGPVLTAVEQDSGASGGSECREVVTGLHPIEPMVGVQKIQLGTFLSAVAFGAGGGDIVAPTGWCRFWEFECDAGQSGNQRGRW